MDRRTPKRFRPPPSPSRPDKGVLRLYVVKVSGLSRQQTTRLIARFRTDGRLEDRLGKPLNAYSWAVRTGDVASEPEPGVRRDVV
ncbi:MAG: hypothetical protein NTX45_21615 [Proteobacteria bacterium]|nr:hypothetical protein [Pseudomonadota bacterium]